jgi:TRAP-type uncharacterized transport system substrate-binding protein
MAWRWVVPGVGLAVLVSAGFFYFHSPRDRSYRLGMTAGNILGTRHRLATKLAEEAGRRGVELRIEPSRGSEEALDLVNSRKLDVALVQGGLLADGRPHVRQVATLHIEPIHLAVRKELFEAASASLTALRGRTIDLEEVGSGTHSLATAVLDFAGLQPRDRDPSRGFVPVSIPRQALFAARDPKRLPDAVFLVSSLPGSTIKYLVAEHGYRLVPLPFAEALALGSLAPTRDDRHEAARGRIDPGRIQATTIPAFTYSVEPPVPARPLPTLGTQLLLVAHEDVPPRAAYRLVGATYAAEFGRIVQPPLDAKLMELPPEFPWHDGSLLYQRRNAPLLSGQAIDSTQKGFAILAAAVSGLFVLWQWSKQYGQFMRDKGFNKYIRELTRIEEEVVQAERGEHVDAQRLLALRERLYRLKTEALDRFTEGELAGKELLAGFLVHVHDVRDYTTSLLERHQGSLQQ